LTQPSVATARVRVPGFVPSQNGLHFANYYPHEPEIQIRLPLGGTLGLGDAANGLCGGMVYVVCDYFEHGTAIPQLTEPPAAGTPLYQFIVHRLLHSFHLPFGLNRYLELMTPLFPDRVRARAMIDREWPAVRTRLDGGHLVPLGLIKVKSVRPRDLAKQHQVLTYGYDLDAGTVGLCIYDPNYPDRDDLELWLNSVTGQLTYSTGESVFCFFHTHYEPQAPPLL
jgi:hypothetical protein